MRPQAIPDVVDDARTTAIVASSTEDIAQRFRMRPLLVQQFGALFDSHPWRTSSATRATISFTSSTGGPTMRKRSRGLDIGQTTHRGGDGCEAMEVRCSAADSMGGMEGRFGCLRRRRWCPSGTLDARWMHAGRTLDARWTHSGHAIWEPLCTAPSQPAMPTAGKMREDRAVRPLRAGCGFLSIYLTALCVHGVPASVTLLWGYPRRFTSPSRQSRPTGGLRHGSDGRYSPETAL